MAPKRQSQKGAVKPSTPAVLDDQGVLELSLSDPRVFEVLVDRYEDSFLGVANKVIRSREEAEEIVQETFVKIYFRGSSFKKQAGATFKSWAWRILLNTAYTHYRKRQKREVPLEEFYDAFIYEESLARERERTDDLNRKETVRRALEMLPVDLAELLRRHYFDGYSYKDISYETGLTLAAIKTRLFRARQQFKDYFLEIAKG